MIDGWMKKESWMIADLMLLEMDGLKRMGIAGLMQTGIGGLIQMGIAGWM
jgi:hypothetical protein